MKQRTPNPAPPAAAGLPAFSFRLEPPMAGRFERVVKASKRSKTSIIEECLEKALPGLEKQYKQAA